MRFMMNNPPTHPQSYPMMLSSRSRTNSLPPTPISVGVAGVAHSLQQPQAIIPEEERYFFPSHQTLEQHQTPTVYQQEYSRGRTYSMPITLHDYETLHLQKLHQERLEKMSQTLLVPANMNNSPAQKVNYFFTFCFQ